MFNKFITPSLFVMLVSGYIPFSIAAKLNVVNDVHQKNNPVSESSNIHQQNLCAASFSLVSTSKLAPKIIKQKINLDSTISMHLSNIVVTKQYSIANIASNVVCQQLVGTSYSGSSEEWKKFFDSGLAGLVNAGFKELSFTLVGTDESHYKQAVSTTQNKLGKATELISKEYLFKGNIDGNEQVIYNLALLNKGNNTLYTFSVSGNSAVKNEVYKTFQQLVLSIKF